MMAHAKKCLVLDLDNTLWGGVVSEDGPLGIAIGFAGAGADFLAFQQAILDLYEQGIILAINSKNNYDDVIDVFRTNPNMVLKEKHFAAQRINWNEKTDNIHALADELNIGLDSMVFLDDDPVNRLRMRRDVPEVETPELPVRSSERTAFLTALPFFSRCELTDEDTMRGNFYITERIRRGAEAGHISRTNFLAELGLLFTCSLDDPSCLARLSQLTEKTNQFNAHRRPMSAEDISHFIASPNYRVFHARASDRYGNYGVIGFALAHLVGETAFLEALLMSCRALGRGFEEAFLSAIANRLRSGGMTTLEISFVETKRNEPIRTFIKRYFGDNNRYDLRRQSIQPAWVTQTWTN